MSFIDCITGQMREGKITPAREEELRRKYEEIYDTYSRSLGDEEAAAAAAERLVKREKQKILRDSENNMRAARAQQKIAADLKLDAQALGAEKDMAKPFFGIVPNKFLFGNPHARAARRFLESIHTRAQSLEHAAHAKIRDVTDRYRSSHAGFKQDVAGFKDVVREIGGINTGSAEAKMHAEALRTLFKDLRAAHDGAGGVIGDIEAREGTVYRFDYFPQTHDAQKVGAADFGTWRADLERMGGFSVYDPKTGLRLDGRQREMMLQQVYENIRSGGMNDIAALAKKMRAEAGKKAEGQGDLKFQAARSLTENLGNVNMRRDPSRLIHFDGMEGFLAYNQKYGSGDTGLFSTAMSYITRMTRDIAVMQKMGPQPAAVMRMMETDLQGEKVGTASINFIKGMYKTVTGLNDAAGELPVWYRANAARMELARAAYYGAAPVSALSDQFFVGYAARMHGMSSTSALGTYYKGFKPGASATRRFMQRHMVISNAVQGMGLQGARFSDAAGRNGMAQFLSGVTHRAGGLGFMTDIGKAAPRLELAGALAEYKAEGKSFAAIDKDLRRMAQESGITAYDWDRAMQAEVTLDGDTGADFLLPENIAALGDAETAAKFGDMFTRIGNLATNEPTLAARTVTTGAFGGGDARPGTWSRAIAQNVFFGKTFPITVTMNYLLPALRASAQGRHGQLAAMVVFGSVFGSMAIQARQLISGKDPRDMTTASFWQAALLQAGGLGLFGDFMFADYNRYGGGPFATALGPNASLVSGLMKAVGPNEFFGAVDGDDNMDTVLAKVWKVASKEIPVVRLWYTRLMVERYVFDQVEKLLDPKYDQRQRRIERRMEKRDNQGFWWKPAELAPRRGPEMDRAAGQ